MGSFKRIQREVLERANKENFKVVISVLTNCLVRCENCRYPQNWERFGKLLKKYSAECLKYHRLNKHRRYGQDRKSLYFYDPLLASTQREKEYLKALLGPLRPCQECIDKYNPTGKRKKPPQNIPADLRNTIKDFLYGKRTR